MLYRIGKSTIGEIIPETAAAIYEVLKDKYLKVNYLSNKNILKVNAIN